MSMKEVEFYIDGASKGNPGPSGIGVVVCRNGETVKNISSFIGNATNNVAEYTALIYALEEALVLKAESVKVNTDSQLLYRQLKRIYKVKNENIAHLFIRVQGLINSFKHFCIINIPRERNSGADKLATKAVKDHFRKDGL